MAARPHLLRDTHWLYQEHEVRKRTVAQIAAKSGCGRAKVAAALEKAGFTVRPAVTPATEVVEYQGPVDCTPFPSRNTPPPATGRCECGPRAILDEDDRCVKCGR